MIEYISGILISKSFSGAIIDTGNIAFNINITLTAYEKLPPPNNKVSVITHLHIKENPFCFVLYGFSNSAERDCFRQLISVSGIGPKTAINLLSAIGYKEFIEIVARGEFNPLIKIPGIGRKSAERIVVDLKDKINKMESSRELTKISHVAGSKTSEVIAALVSLGYNKPDAEKMVGAYSNSGKIDEMSIEDVIKTILRSS